MTPTRLSTTIDPLRIDWIEVPTTTGLLGLTECPGRQHRNPLRSYYNRDLDADLDAIAASGARLLVTLMQAEEMEEYGVAPLPFRADALGLTWLHLPIPDMRAPDRRFERLYRAARGDLHGRLARGERLVFHCLAGLGRSGTIAARILVEFGMEPLAAIEAVRKVRPGAIQTDAQFRAVLAARG